MAKTKKTKTSKPFATKAPKGKVRIHFIIGVADTGKFETYTPLQTDTLDQATDEIDFYYPIPSSVEFHHVFVDVPVPKKTKVKVKKAKAKKVATKKSEGSEDLDPEAKIADWMYLPEA